MCDLNEFQKRNVPFLEEYHAETDTTDLYSPEKISKYRSLIGSANWLITLGRFDVAFATSTLARYSSAPREGHFVAAQQIFGYLRKFPKGQLTIDPGTCPERKLATIT